MRRHLGSQIGVAQEVGEGAPAGPIKGVQHGDALEVVGEETALVAVDGGLDDEEGGGRGPALGLLLGFHQRVCCAFEVPLFADERSDEGIVVLHQRVGLR